MNDKFEQDMSQYKQLLDNSVEELDPKITEQLNSSRKLALETISKGKTWSIASLVWRPALALLIPALVISGIFFIPNTTEQEQSAADFYADLEILMDEEELEFLTELEISQWIDPESEG